MDRTRIASTLACLLLSAAPARAQDASQPAEDVPSAQPPSAEPAPAPATSPEPALAPEPASAPPSRAPRREHPATPTPDEAEGCTHQQAPVFDPGSPRLELSAGGGYAAYFVTWRSISDFMTEGREADGLWQGGFFRGEVAFALGSLSLSAVYTHAFVDHDGPVDTANGQHSSLGFQLLTAEIGLQCACHDSTYVWSFAVEGGYEIANGSMMIGLEHRSLWYLWEGLFIGFDFDIGILIGFPFTDSSGRPGPSGGGFETSLFLGYALG